jgi:hypothetical protein
VGSNPTRGMDVCVDVFCVYVLLCVGNGLATGLFPVQGLLPSVYRIKKLKNAAKVQKKGYILIDRQTDRQTDRQRQTDLPKCITHNGEKSSLSFHPHVSFQTLLEGQERNIENVV